MPCARTGTVQRTLKQRRSSAPSTVQALTAKQKLARADLKASQQRVQSAEAELVEAHTSLGKHAAALRDAMGELQLLQADYTAVRHVELPRLEAAAVAARREVDELLTRLSHAQEARADAPRARPVHAARA